MAGQSNNNTVMTQVPDPVGESYDNYLLIDVGSNMANKKFNRDLESVLQRAKDSGMCLFVFVYSSFMYDVIRCWACTRLVMAANI